jgi:hypothetical protein
MCCIHSDISCLVPCMCCIHDIACRIRCSCCIHSDIACSIRAGVIAQAGFDHGGDNAAEAILDRYDNVTMVATGASFYRNCFPPGSVSPSPLLPSAILPLPTTHAHGLSYPPLYQRPVRGSGCASLPCTDGVCESTMVVLSARAPCTHIWGVHSSLG